MRPGCPTILDRFWAKVREDESGCWLWTAVLNNKGYGTISSRCRPIFAHRFSYELHSGEPIPPGAEIDHICHVTHCVNPAHLRLATRKQNNENRSGVEAASGYRGVHWVAKVKRWRVIVSHNGKTYSGGYFSDVRDADRAAAALRNSLFTHNVMDRKAS